MRDFAERERETKEPAANCLQENLLPRPLACHNKGVKKTQEVKRPKPAVLTLLRITFRTHKSTNRVKGKLSTSTSTQPFVSQSCPHPSPHLHQAQPKFSPAKEVTVTHLA